LAICKIKYLAMAKSFKPLKAAPAFTNESVLKNTASFFIVPAGQRD
jgi:hypothetical protein